MKMNVVLIVLLAGLAIAFGLVWAVQRQMIYFPLDEVPPPSTAGLERVEEIAYTTRDGLGLRGWFVAGRNGYTVLVFNGNAGNRAYRAPLAEALRAFGFSVLLTDYRGYGGNPGSPSEDGLAADSRAARDYLLSRPDVDRERIVYFGESLGAAVALALAVEHPPAALVLRSPFTSLAAVGAYHYRALPVRWLLRDRFDSIGRVRRLRAPLLVIAGDADAIVPFAQSRELYEAAPEPKTFVAIRGADHNDPALLSGREMIGAMVKFVTGL
jgi:fermentation-respiration switch protein FrsA (DUF1100 family)